MKVYIIVCAVVFVLNFLSSLKGYDERIAKEGKKRAQAPARKGRKAVSENDGNGVDDRDAGWFCVLEGDFIDSFDGGD